MPVGLFLGAGASYELGMPLVGLSPSSSMRPPSRVKRPSLISFGRVQATEPGDVGQAQMMTGENEPHH